MKTISLMFATVLFAGAVPSSTYYDLMPQEPPPEKKIADYTAVDKLALALEGAHVIYSGHSNFGLGPNFMLNTTRTVDDYMNVSNPGVATIQNITILPGNIGVGSVGQGGGVKLKGLGPTVAAVSNRHAQPS